MSEKNTMGDIAKIEQDISVLERDIVLWKARLDKAYEQSASAPGVYSDRAIASEQLNQLRRELQHRLDRLDKAKKGGKEGRGMYEK
jgi:hypothetical protein